MLKFIGSRLVARPLGYHYSEHRDARGQLIGPLAGKAAHSWEVVFDYKDKRGRTITKTREDLLDEAGAALKGKPHLM